MKTISIALLGSVLSMSALAGQFNVDIVKQQDVNWHFQRVLVSTVDDAVLVSGRLTAANRFGLPRGHVDIAAFTPIGELLAETTISYTPGILTRRMQRQGGIRFHARFDQKLPSDAVIKLAFHREPLAAPKQPVHQVNMAR